MPSLRLRITEGRPRWNYTAETSTLTSQRVRRRYCNSVTPSPDTLCQYL